MQGGREVGIQIGRNTRITEKKRDTGKEDREARREVNKEGGRQGGR